LPVDAQPNLFPGFLPSLVVSAIGAIVLLVLVGMLPFGQLPLPEAILLPLGRATERSGRLWSRPITRFGHAGRSDRRIAGLRHPSGLRK
jgi:hypothetical protein